MKKILKYASARLGEGSTYAGAATALVGAFAYDDKPEQMWLLIVCGLLAIILPTTKKKDTAEGA